VGQQLILDRGNFCRSDGGYGHNVCFARSRANLSTSNLSCRIGSDSCTNNLGERVHGFHNFEGCQCSLRQDRNSFSARFVAEETDKWGKVVKFASIRQNNLGNPDQVLRVCVPRIAALPPHDRGSDSTMPVRLLPDRCSPKCTSSNEGCSAASCQERTHAPQHDQSDTNRKTARGHPLERRVIYLM
jgi:hypothetical protein